MSIQYWLVNANVLRIACAPASSPINPSARPNSQSKPVYQTFHHLNRKMNVSNRMREFGGATRAGGLMSMSCLPRPLVNCDPRQTGVSGT